MLGLTDSLHLRLRHRLAVMAIIGPVKTEGLKENLTEADLEVGIIISVVTVVNALL